MAQTYFASIQPGLEEALLREVRRAGGNRARILHGGVEFDAARKTLYAAHLHLSTPSRIWLRVDEFRARDAPELYNKTRRYGWERLIGGEHAIEVRASSSKSRLYHTGKIKDAVADGIRDRFADDLADESAPRVGDVPAKADNRLCVMARIHDDRCQLNLDASGDLLHRRGWRTEIGEAPMRETIAAAMLEMVEWNPEEGLVDPMCGSGTIAIEAALRATGRAPGLARDFAFQRWRNFQPERYAAMAEELQAEVTDAIPAPIVGRDRAAQVVDIAKRNAGRAGVESLVTFEKADLIDAALPDQPRWIVTNPPYGDRLSDEGAVDALLNQWREREEPGHLVFLWPRDRRDAVKKRAGENLTPKTTFENGGIAVDLWSSL